MPNISSTVARTGESLRVAIAYSLLLDALAWSAGGTLSRLVER
jgi:hypothetical protein